MLPGPQPFIIAEVGLNHDGSLGNAHAFIDAIAQTGASAVKFQTHIAEAESSDQETFRVNFSYADQTRYDYWQRTSFTEEQWAGLKKHADEKGLAFLSSPFSPAAIDLLERLGMPVWKVASGETGSLQMLERMAATGKPLIVSTGLSSYAEVDSQVERLRRLCPGRFALLQCTTSYPTPAKDVGLNVMTEFARRYHCPVGLSDHSGTMFPSLVATWLGASILEVHVTLSPQAFGPDISSSLTIGDLRSLVDGVRFVTGMRDSPVDKDALAAEKAPLRKLFGKSAFTTSALLPGELIERENLMFRKPGTGISELELAHYLGRPLVRPVAAGAMLSKSDFGNE